MSKHVGVRVCERGGLRACDVMLTVGNRACMCLRPSQYTEQESVAAR